VEDFDRMVSSELHIKALRDALGEDKT